ncbi:helix-turn-helix transcriptional regulator [Nocardia nova]|nr:helix-turn-helix transcriptional regulator [Nocardia nova]
MGVGQKYDDSGIPPNDLGRRLREIRAWRGLSLEAAAGLAGISYGYLGKLERGEKSLENRRTTRRSRPHYAWRRASSHRCHGKPSTRAPTMRPMPDWSRSKTCSTSSNWVKTPGYRCGSGRPSLRTSSG